MLAESVDPVPPPPPPNGFWLLVESVEPAPLAPNGFCVPPDCALVLSARLKKLARTHPKLDFMLLLRSSR